MSKPNNPPAFPITGEILASCKGMTLRDWFAGQAIGALIRNDGYCQANVPIFAEQAYELADAMLAEREA